MQLWRSPSQEISENGSILCWNFRGTNSKGDELEMNIERRKNYTHVILIWKANEDWRMKCTESTLLVEIYEDALPSSRSFAIAPFELRETTNLYAPRYSFRKERPRHIGCETWEQLINEWGSASKIKINTLVVNQSWWVPFAWHWKAGSYFSSVE